MPSDLHANDESHFLRILLVVSPIAALSGCSPSEGILNPASPDARLVAELSLWMSAVAVFVAIVTIGMLFVGLGLQSRGVRQLSRAWATALVICGGVAAPFLAVAAVSASGVFIGSETEERTISRGPTIEVVGERWWWEFRYIDKNGETIATTANELHLPVGQRTRLRLVSKNVIHSFWVPNLQGKTDLVPGVVNILYAEPEIAGVWRGQCAELCGLQHALMGFLVIAQPKAEFDTWLDRQAAPAKVTEGDGVDAFYRQGCPRCHTIRGTGAMGDQGPDLTHLASRRTIAAGTLPNTRDNLREWISVGQKVKPGNLMPEFLLPPDEFSALLDFLKALE